MTCVCTAAHRGMLLVATGIRPVPERIWKGAIGWSIALNVLAFALYYWHKAAAFLGSGVPSS
jgi:hypothetical protein